MTGLPLEDPERTRHRLELLNGAFRGLLAIHGGGIVALLAYLQAIGTQNTALSKVVLAGMVPLGVGLVLAVLFMALRYHTSLADQRGNSGWLTIRSWAFVSFYASLALFVLGLMILIVGAWALLDAGPNRP